MSSESSLRFVQLDASGSNWHTWQTTAKFELKARKAWKYFDPENPASSCPEKNSADDIKKIWKGDLDETTAPVLLSYTTWEEECNVAIACLARLVNPIHANILDCSTLPKECWDALVVCFAGQSVQGITLIQTKLAALNFADDALNTLSDILATFNGLILNLKRAGHTMQNAEICSHLVLTMPLCLQPMVSTLQEGTNSANPTHWYQALSTTWERLKAVRANKVTFAVKHAITKAKTSSSHNACHECHNPGLL